jgi:hypothetical protein
MGAILLLLAGYIVTLVFGVFSVAQPRRGYGYIVLAGLVMAMAGMVAVAQWPE